MKTPEMVDQFAGIGPLWNLLVERSAGEMEGLTTSSNRASGTGTSGVAKGERGAIKNEESLKTVKTPLTLSLVSERKSTV